MRTFSSGKELLRLLILVSVFAMVLTGCRTAEYDAVEQQISTELGQSSAESPSLQAETTEESTSADVTETQPHVTMAVPGASTEAIQAAEMSDVPAVMMEERALGDEADTEPSEDAESASGDTEEASPSDAEAAALAVEAAEPFQGHIVAIDAGYQAKANAEKEPIGPTSDIMKAKMQAGATGTATGVKEYELTLAVAQKLEAQLKEQGYKVIMVRTTHDVNLSNAERAKIANESGADIFIRLYANSMENSGIYGAMATCMTEHNPYNASLSADSYRLSKQIVDNICAQTGTKNRGVQKVDNSSIINWCEIPVAAVHMGYLTNPDEDRWLQEEDYQNKIVNGIAEAVGTYFAQ